MNVVKLFIGSLIVAIGIAIISLAQDVFGDNSILSKNNLAKTTIKVAGAFIIYGGISWLMTSIKGDDR